MLKVMIAPVTPFQQNCSIVWDSDTMEGTAVDPGGDFELLKQTIDEQGIKVTKVMLTHGHVDHASAAGTMAEHYGVEIEGPHKDDLFLMWPKDVEGGAVFTVALKKAKLDPTIDAAKAYAAMDKATKEGQFGDKGEGTLI